jgi:co-chaperonin GroES (HSP10)
MNCKECKEVVNEKIITVMKKYEVPFICELCGVLKFPYQATRDVVFVYPKKPKEKIGRIIIPEQARQEQEYAVVLSVGKGYWNKKGKFIPTEIKVGDEVVYDKLIPWTRMLVGPDGRRHMVKYMGYQDVKGVISDF